MAIIKIIPMPGPKGDAGDGSGVSSTVPFNLNDTNENLLLSITKSGTGTTRITAPQDDLALRSARDIILYPGDDGPGNVYINWGDATIAPNATNRVATIADIQQGTTGDITFDGVKIIGAGTASGDGQSNSTIEIVPDADLYANDQYLIIDPTNPNHIHIRAGGTQDESNADLILGGERNNIYIEDDARKVSISTRVATVQNVYTNASEIDGAEMLVPESANITEGTTVNVDGTEYPVTSFEADPLNGGFSILTATGASFVSGASYTFSYEELYSNNYWEFSSNGYLNGPAMGGLFVSGIINGESDLWLASSESIVLNGYGETGGEFLGDSSIPGNQIATIDDVANYAPEETAFTVNGGTLGTQPTFTGAPLFSGTYVKIGPQVHFQIQVDMDNITNFGTGQYYVDLPFPAKYSYHFRDACLHDNSGTVRQYALSGHVYAGQSQVTLWFTSTSGQDELFDYNSPALLTVNDNFHIAGTYISAS